MLRKFVFRRHLIILEACVLLLGIMLSGVSFAQAAPSASVAAKAKNFKAVPFVYDPTHSHIVSAHWVADQGLPDKVGNKNYALLLTKLGKTSTNAASGATITKVKGITLTELGFDVRSDGHCGAGAPRFNVVTNDGVLHFAGCAAATQTTTLTDPQGNTWLRKRIDPNSSAQWFPSPPDSLPVKSISIIFDEGTDQGQGYTYLDNIDINGTLIGQP